MCMKCTHTSSIIQVLIDLLLWMTNVIAYQHRTQEGGNCVLVFLAGISDLEAIYSAFIEAEKNIKANNPSAAAAAASSLSSPVKPTSDSSSSSSAASSSAASLSLPAFFSTGTCFSHLQLIMLHSLLEPLDIFSPIPTGVTRVILSTNIAESSVTIPNVRYVVDFGTHKEVGCGNLLCLLCITLFCVYDGLMFPRVLMLHFVFFFFFA